ncbi:MAG TPA: septal ring lytic transglycosylase RlpA family protein [Rhodothermales bacterium]|nr:septal ring lytic transglycosylase RlpA family protein [Rhodothermales bacterium]
MPLESIDNGLSARQASGIGPLVRGRSPLTARFRRFLVVVAAAVLSGLALGFPLFSGPRLESRLLTSGLANVQFGLPPEAPPVFRLVAVHPPDSLLEADSLQMLDSLAEDEHAGALPEISILKEIGSGQASYYGSELAGRRTASGERFDPSRLTAAHRTLPFGTLVRVTNLHNGESVVVRINDRGPFAARRVIDLSRAAARKIGMLARGTAKVRLELVAN